MAMDDAVLHATMTAFTFLPNKKFVSWIEYSIIPNTRSSCIDTYSSSYLQKES